MNEAVKAATAEMMAAWKMVRKDFPKDHEINAERILKAAFSKLNADSSAIISAQSLRQVYAELR